MAEGRYDQPVHETMLSSISDQYNLSADQLGDAMNRIAFHETGAFSRMNPETVQRGGGPGRGLFQFEKTYKYPEGHELAGQYGQAGGMTARNRTANWFQKHHDWLTQEGMEDPSIGFDASKLTANQQKMLFMGNTAMGKGMSFEGINPDNIGDWWQKHHYAGEQDKTGLFDESMGAYDLIYKPTAEEAAFGRHSMNDNKPIPY